MGAYLKYIRKALIAGGAALAQIAVVISPDSAGGSAITVTEWVSVVTAALAAIGVYAVSNGSSPDPGGAHEA